MTFDEYINEFFGMPVLDFKDEFITNKKDNIDPKVVYRISVSYDDEDTKWLDFFSRFLTISGVEDTTALIVGCWEEMFDNSSEDIVEAIVTAMDRMPHLRALFISDATSMDCEISWIIQSIVTPIFKAYPQLEYFGIRGSGDLSFMGIEHENLKTLIVQSGGLDSTIVREIFSGKLPELEHLELWLGVEDYGGNCVIEDFKDLFAGRLFPKLKYLGLRNSKIADEIAKAIVNAPILERIEVLDLSMGTLSDEGAKELVSSLSIKKLKKLDLHHHYCTKEMMDRLKKLEEESGVEVDVSNEQEDDYYNDTLYRYVAVSE